MSTPNKIICGGYLPSYLNISVIKSEGSYKKSKN